MKQNLFQSFLHYQSSEILNNRMVKYLFKVKRIFKRDLFERAQSGRTRHTQLLTLNGQGFIERIRDFKKLPGLKRWR